MPAYNSEKTISDSILSVINQEYSNFELLICDDGSTDKTIDIIMKYVENDSRVRLISNKYKKGAAGARNSCINGSNARFISFLDSDDLWDKEKLYVQVNYMLEFNLAMSHGEYLMFDENQNVKKIIPNSIVDYSNILKKCDIGCLTVMLDRLKIGSIQFPDMPKEDYALWVMVMKNSIISSSYPGCYAWYRKQKKSISSSKFKEISKQWYVLKKIANVGYFYRVKYIFTYIFNGVFKHFL
ncbi:UNVERIFIED_CONTAM: hypothetical protein GTU68_017512 [Idotea baltica]|nr:hypothetical protein [Idotea baltica]